MTCLFVRRDVPGALRHDFDDAFHLSIVGRYALRCFIGIRGIPQGTVGEAMANDCNDNCCKTAIERA